MPDNNLSDLLAATTPLVAVVAPIVAAIRKAVPAIDGAPRVLATCGVLALLILLAGFSGPWSLATVAVALLKAIALTAQTFGAVELGDRWFRPDPPPPPAPAVPAAPASSLIA